MIVDTTGKVTTDAPAEHTDILVVGAGFAGLPIALACARAGWRVSLVDPLSSDIAVPGDSMDQRCTAISSASEGLLRRWGAWDAIEADAEPIHTVHISQKGYLGSVRLRAEELDVNALGYVVDNRRWVAALAELVRAEPNIRWHRGQTLTKVGNGNRNRQGISDADGPTAIVELASGGRISAQLLLAVDGLDSSVRQHLDIATTCHSFDQQALMSTVRLSKPHQSCAYERFTRAGPVALLPRPDQHMSLVWCVPSSAADYWAGADDAAVIQRIQELFGYTLGRVQAIGPRQCVPLARREAVQQAANRTLLLGNAARLLHPVAGQGFNLVVRDVACLLDLIGLQTGRSAPDPGHATVLKRFATMRVRDQQRTVSLTDTLATAFLGEAGLAAHVRGLGMLALDVASPLKRHFARQMMGYTG